MFKIYKKIILTMIILTTFMGMLNLKVCFGESITIDNFNDAIENSKELDGKEFIIKGEAIGEPLRRKDGTWINVSDGSVAVGLFMKNELADNIKVYGNYDYKGDIIEAKGIFHKACTAHDGEIDFHINEIKVISKGKVTIHKITKMKIFIFTVLSIIFICILLIFIARKRQKRI